MPVPTGVGAYPADVFYLHARLLERATQIGRVLVSQDEDILREGAKRLGERRGFSGIIYAHQLR